MVEKIQITFFGSGPVAAESLELLTENFDIEAVVTKPKPEHHRGDFPVVELANKLGLKLIYASSKAELSEVFKSKPVSSQLGVVIDYGVIIGRDVVDYFPLGIVNSHFSLLPQWRGADPITFAILSGQKQTGVSLMLINEKMDEGDILAQGVYDMPEGITTPELTDYLIGLSDALLVNYLPMYIEGKIKPISQSATAKTMGMILEATYSRKLKKDDGKLDWNKPAAQLECEVRAYVEWPKSFTKLGRTDVIITKASVGEDPDSSKFEVGRVRVFPDKKLAVVTSNGLLEIEKLKPIGKNEMTASEFLAGYGQTL